MIRFGVIGYGYWGPNIVRNLQSVDGATVVSVCDSSTNAQRRVKQAYPHVHVTADCNEILTSTDIDEQRSPWSHPVWTRF